MTLAVGLQQQGHQVGVLSTAWVSPDNQYLRRLQKSHVEFGQLPKWISRPASHWVTKEKIVTILLWLASPLILLTGSLLSLIKMQSLRKSFVSARNWLRGQVMTRFIAPDWRKPFVRLMLAFWKLRWRPDILHIQGYTNSLLFVIDWAYAQKIPIVYEEHQTPDARFDWWQGFQYSINKAEVVVAVSETSAEALRTICGVTQPIVVQGPLVPDPMSQDWGVNTVGQSANGSLRLTAMARLFPTKGISYLLDALAEVKKIHPNTHLKVYGEGPLRDELLSQASRLGLDGEAILMGAFTSREELARIMTETDVFVMPSLLEGQPVALVEAMSYGRPIIATTVGGIPELIQDSENGLLCAPGDSKCLVSKIKKLVEDPLFRMELGRSARRSYESGPFQPAAVSNRFVSIYDQALQKRFSKL